MDISGLVLILVIILLALYGIVIALPSETIPEWKREALLRKSLGQKGVSEQELDHSGDPTL